MGKESIERPAKHNGAEGAYVPFPSDELTIKRAIDQVVDFFRVLSWQPCSAKWVGTKFPMLRRIIDMRFCELTEGCHLEEVVSDDWLREHWQYGRRYGFQEVRDDMPKRLRQDTPLFHPEERSGVIYAASSTLATIPGRFIKIGFYGSEQREDYRRDVLRYLSGKRLAHDPILMAHTPGDLKTEGHYHDDWKALLADGREYYWPEERLATWIKHTFAIVEPDFDLTFRAAIETHSELL